MGVDSGVGQTSVENSDFSKFYVRDKLVSLNLANLEMDENSANDKISRSKGSTLYGLSHEDTVKEFNDNTDLSVSSLANSCGTERKLQDNKASGKFVRHTVTLPIVEAFYPKPNVETGEGSAKPSSANVSSDSPKDATADEVTNVSNSITTKLDNNVEKKEAVESDEKKEAADDDKIEVTKDEKKEAAEEDDKKEAVEPDEKKEAAEEDEKKETADDDKIEVTKDEKKETVESDDKKDSLVMEQNTDTDSSQKRRRIHKRKSSQINQVTASPTTQDMNQSTKELNTSKDGLYADNLKLENINNIALINTSSPQSTEVHPSSTALPVVPDAVLLSNKDKEQHRQIEAIVSKGKSAPESINKDETNPTKSSEMSSPSMNSDHSHQPQYPGQYPRLSYDRSYHLRSNEGYQSKLYLKAKIVRKNIVEVHISSHQDISCFIIGRSGLRSPKTTIYSTQGRTRRIHLSSWFTPYQVECGDNDVCTVTERFDE